MTTIKDYSTEFCKMGKFRIIIFSRRDRRGNISPLPQNKVGMRSLSLPEKPIRESGKMLRSRQPFPVFSQSAIA
ncbi:MAG: hypothetical protein AB4290_04090 [Spirulina sp.]